MHPVTSEETGIVVAVILFGDPSGRCVGTGYYVRTDITWAQQFMRPYL